MGVLAAFAAGGMLGFLLGVTGIYSAALWAEYHDPTRHPRD